MSTETESVRQKCLRELREENARLRREALVWHAVAQALPPRDTALLLGTSKGTLLGWYDGRWNALNVKGLDDALDCRVVLWAYPPATPALPAPEQR